MTTRKIMQHHLTKWGIYILDTCSIELCVWKLAC